MPVEEMGRDATSLTSKMEKESPEPVNVDGLEKVGVARKGISLKTSRKVHSPASTLIFSQFGIRSTSNPYILKQ